MDWREGVAIQYNNLGIIMRECSDRPAAREMWMKARDLLEQLGAADRVSKAQALLDQLPNSSAPASGD